mmetsp:Transcript_35866/g.64053  ORF Transcript_35866/g.64053 Transcript_35866/m.64053 type:complete len:209 (-) Transcript_35866:767-1393(-)
MPIGRFVKLHKLDFPLHRLPRRDPHGHRIGAEPSGVIGVVGLCSYNGNLFRRHQAHRHLHPRREGAIAESEFNGSSALACVVHQPTLHKQFVLHPHCAVFQWTVHRELAVTVSNTTLGDTAVTRHVTHLNDMHQRNLILHGRLFPTERSRHLPTVRVTACVGRGEEERRLPLQHGAQARLQMRPHLPRANGDIQWRLRVRCYQHLTLS